MLAAVAFGTVVLLVFLHQIARVSLLIFAAMLFATLLGGLTDLIGRILPIRRWVRFGLALLFFTGALVGFWALLGPRLAREVERLANQLPEAIEQARQQLYANAWARQLAETLGLHEATRPGDLLARATRAVSTTFGVVTDALIVLLIGVYLAATPESYVRAVLRMIPPARRERGRAIFCTLSHVLRRWLAGRFASMTVIGLFSMIGLFVLGVPLAVTLGFLAGTLAFIPFLGPILALVPAVLIGFVEGGIMMSLYVFILYMSIQAVEGSFITPMIEKKAVFLPPAFVIIVQIIAGVLAGLLGVLLATPAAVVVVVLLQMLYVEDVLGERVRVLGAKKEDREERPERTEPTEPAGGSEAPA